jgi:hypothetical protein
MNEIKRKLTSRKFWMAVAGFVVGVVTLWDGGATNANITGCIMSLGSVVAYIIGEGLADSARGGDGGGS